ncbi:hypothetical protein QFZ22_008877 [Streptomyces canus]|uniref:TerD domain-containing protein n=1 Tax=Streptomyces canus TaxID=58343 RepID=A0AAW8FUZ7_9ACTN|nr:hypothetical protein [Streptomyces canus]
MVFGELYRKGPEWKFRAVGQRRADREGFERVVRLTLDCQDIRSDLGGDRTGRVAACWEVRARSAAEEMAAAADDEYRDCPAARGPPGADRERGLPRGPHGIGGRSGARDGPRRRHRVARRRPTRALVSAAAAVLLLLIGYGPRLAAPAAELGAQVADAGRTCALLAVLSTGFSPGRRWSARPCVGCGTRGVNRVS